MKARFIPLQTFNGAINMAMDEVLMDKVRKKESLPIFRLYKWSPACVSIGYFQGLDLEVNRDACKEHGVDIVRRQTGGGAVFHETEITYSIIAPEKHFAKDIKKSYEEICFYITNALKKLGMDAHFSPINDVLISNQKISGNAQTRKDGILLQHGTILCKVDGDKMFQLLKVSDEKRSDKLIASVKKAVTSLEHHHISEEDFMQAFVDSFDEEHELVEDNYTQDELEAAKVLAKTKYGHDDWVAMR